MTTGNEKFDEALEHLSSKLSSGILFFDLETQNLFSDLEPSWTSIQWKERQKIRKGLCNKMKVSIAGILVFENNEPNYKYFTEEQMPLLEEELLKSDKIIGHNLLGFDYEVLTPYISEDSLKQIKNKTIDTMQLIATVTRKWSGLGHLGKLNFKTGKTVNTLEIPEMWRDGKHDEVRDYLKNDLDLLACLFYYGLTKQPLKYNVKNRDGLVSQQEVTLNWEDSISN